MKKFKIPIILTVVALVAYYAIFVFRISTVIEGKRYYNAADDVMITMNYGRTLAQGAGWAWYPGGPNGGASSIGWVLTSALAWMLWPDTAKTPILIQILNGVLWLLVIYLVYKCSTFIADKRVGWVATILTATCWPVTNLFVQGWEFSVVAVGLLLILWADLTKKLQYAILGIAAIVFVRFPIWNTAATLKLTGYPYFLMFTRGAWMEGSNLLSRGLPITIIALIASWYYKRWLPMIMYVGAVLLSIVIGGDVWHNIYNGSRIAISATPLVIVMAAAGFGILLSNIKSSKPTRWLIPVATVLLLAASWTFPVNTLLIDKPKYYDSSYPSQIRLGLWLRDSTPVDTKIAVVTAGIIPWIAEHKRFYDMLGINDDSIAKKASLMPGKDDNKFTYFVPGHQHFCPWWTATFYKVDIVAQSYGVKDSPESWEHFRGGWFMAPVIYAGQQSLLLVRNDFENPVRPWGTWRIR